MSAIEEDHDNPIWTREDFARAKGPEHLPPEMLAAFPKTVERLERERTKLDTPVITALRSQSFGVRNYRLAA